MLPPCRPGSSPRRMHAAGRGEFLRGTVRGHPAPPPRYAVGVCAVSDDPPCNPGLLRCVNDPPRRLPAPGRGGGGGDRAPGGGGGFFFDFPAGRPHPPV